jgi:hypothetical protein
MLRALTEQERQDQEWWNERRIFSPSDNEALSRYFTHLSQASDVERACIENAFTEAEKAGYRPKLCVALAMER